MLLLLITVSVCLLGVGIWLFKRIDTAPYPNATSWLLRIPLPWITNRKLLKLLAPFQGEHLVEIGPGTGLQTTAVASHLGASGTLAIVDVQPVMLAHTIKRVERRHLMNVTPIQTTAEHLPFENNSFDGGYLVTALGEIPSPVTALKELRRTIKPTGRLIIGEWVYDKHGVSQAQLRDFAVRSGFKIDIIKGNKLAYLAKLI